MINPKFMKCVMENMFQKYSGKNNLEVIFNKDKMVFSENMGCWEPYVGVRRNPMNNY